MPSFMQFADQDIDALVEYVKYLSIRGETELYLLSLVVDQGQRLPLDLEQVREDGVKPIDDAWQRRCVIRRWWSNRPRRRPTAGRSTWPPLPEAGGSF